MSTVFIVVLMMFVIAFLLYLFLDQDLSFLACLGVVMDVALWIAIIYIVIHFINKYW